MNNAKPTPGPWYVSDILDNGKTGVITGTNLIIIGVPNYLGIEDKRLIAAAPELLEACNSICEAMAFTPKEHLAAALDRSYNLCRAAIAKAIAPPTRTQTQARRRQNHESA